MSGIADDCIYPAGIYTRKVVFGNCVCTWSGVIVEVNVVIYIADRKATTCINR